MRRFRDTIEFTGCRRRTPPDGPTFFFFRSFFREPFLLLSRNPTTIRHTRNASFRAIRFASSSVGTFPRLYVSTIRGSTTSSSRSAWYFSGARKLIFSKSIPALDSSIWAGVESSQWMGSVPAV